MKILMILDGEFPPDERVEKEAISLINEGNSVFMLCLNYGSFGDEEDYRGIRIRRIRINRTFRNKIMASYLVLPFYRWLWKKEINGMVRTQQPDVIHVHDLPLSDIAISLKKKRGIKVVCDQHELYSNWIVRTAHYNTFTGKIIKALSNWKKYEKKNLSAADMVVTVEEPLKKLYIKSGIKAEKIVVLPNTPNASVFNPSKMDEELVKKYSRNFVIFYAGTIDKLRGIDTVIAALPLLRKSIPEIKFVFAGRFREKYFNPLKLVEKHAVSDLVDYAGWVGLDRLPFLVSSANICLHVPPASSKEVNNSIATKIYQYVLMNKPVIVGQARMMRQFVEENGIGLSIRESDPGDLADKISLMHSSPDMVAGFIENTRRIAPLYTWETTSKPFIDYYKTLSR